MVPPPGPPLKGQGLVCPRLIPPPSVWSVSRPTPLCCYRNNYHSNNYHRNQPTDSTPTSTTRPPPPTMTRCHRSSGGEGGRSCRYQQVSTVRNTPFLYTLSTHPIYTPYQYTLSIHLIDTPYQYTLSIHLIDTHYQHILSTHTSNTPSQHTLSIHPLDTPSCSIHTRY